jgi:addiction module HigA family antidote
MAESTMKRPPTHPGEVLKEDVLPSMAMTQAELAELLGLSRKTVHQILNGASPVSPETAVKLGTLLRNSPQFWLNMQSSYDVWVAREQLGQDALRRLEARGRELPTPAKR